MNQKIASVIIPIHRVEKYLRQCVDSVLVQDYTALEVILVDDGSPDGSPAICDEYASNDRRVKVIHKENGGLSDARNVGLEKATGEFVVFLDSDDFWIDEHFLKDVLCDDTLNKADVILFERVSFKDGGDLPKQKQGRLSVINDMSKEDAVVYMVRHDLFGISAWSRIVRRSLLVDNNITFEKGRLSEDFDWTMRVTLAANCIRGYDKRIYGYRIRQGSISNSFSPKHMNDLLTVIERWAEILQTDNTAPTRVSESMLGYCAYQYCILLGYFDTFDDINKALFKERVVALTYLLDYPCGRKVQIAKVIKRLNGGGQMCSPSDEILSEMERKGVGKRIRILVVSNTPWDDSNSFGSSYSNIFGGNDNYEIANVYCRPGVPKTKVAKRFFQITEKSIIKNLFKRNKRVGAEVTFTDDELSVKDSSAFRFGQRHRWRILYWGRNLIWGAKRWKSVLLDAFLDDFKPDVIFQPVYYSTYIGEIALYAKRRLDIPMIGYVSDDNYTLKQFSLSLAFWAERLYIRRYVKRVIDACSVLYTITPRQRDEYNELFGNKCKVLTKGCLFDDSHNVSELHRPIKLMYAGGLGNGRLNTLSLIAKAIEKFNNGEKKTELDIYSQMPLSDKQKALLNIDGASVFKGEVTPDEIKEVQEDTDVFVHVESFGKKERYTARLSFSTKITDYLQTGKCVMAVGWEQTGAIEMLKNNNAAFVITSEESIEREVGRLLSDENLIKTTGKKGYEYGKREFDIHKIRTMVFSDIDFVIKNIAVR